MIVSEAALSSQRHELRSNTITATLHISEGLDDYLLNVIIDLYVRKQEEEGAHASVSRRGGGGVGESRVS